MIRKIAALVGGSALALSLVGAGVGATFTASGSANDTISVGNMSIAAYASNDNVNWGSGCTIMVTASSGSQVCHVAVNNLGTVIPSHLQIVATVTNASVPAAEYSLWTVTDYQSSTGTLDNNNPPTWNYAAPVFNWDAPYTVTWTGLSNASLGTWFVLTFTANATA